MKFEIETHRLLQSQWTQNVLMLIDIHTERARAELGARPIIAAYSTPTSSPFRER